MLLFAGMFLIFNSATIRRQSPASDGTVFAGLIEDVSAGQTVVDKLVYEADGANAKVVGYRNGISGTLKIPSTVTLTGEQSARSVVKIGESAFYGCSGLQVVIIPDSVTVIDSMAFYECQSLTTVYMLGQNVALNGYSDDMYPFFCNADDEYWNSGDLVNGGYLIYVTSAGYSNYTSQNASDMWQEYNSKNVIKQIDPSGLLVQRVDDTGAFGPFEEYCRIVGYAGSTTSLTIPSTITLDGTPCEVLEIGREAFKGVSLNSVTIPGCVQTINGGAFDGCGLTSVTLNEGLIGVGGSAFKGNNFTTITIPSTVSAIGNWAFVGCNSLTSVYFKGGVDLLDYGEFADDPGFFKVNEYDGEFRSGVSSSTVGIYVPEDYLSDYISVAEGYDGRSWGLYTDLLKGYDPSSNSGENTGVVADIVLPSFMVIVLIGAIVIVAKRRKIAY
ncbi:MAG TPA: hypothetical protein DCO89_00070 [Clostridiales bacterium]|nr:hypothetical protein [Clostridiales bacterium]